MSEKKPAEQVVLRNVRVKYAKLIRPGQAFDEGQPDLWSVNMYVTEEDRHRLSTLGAMPKLDKNSEEFFVAKRNVSNKKGEAVKPPSVVDGKKAPFAEEVGNGSVCNIAVTPFEWEKGRVGSPSYKTGILLYLNAVQVVTHVALSGGVDAFDVIEEPAELAQGKEVDDLPF